MSEFVSFDAWARVGLAMVWTIAVGSLVGVGLPLRVGRFVDRIAFAAVSGIGLLVAMFTAAEAIGFSFSTAMMIAHVMAGGGAVALVVHIVRRRDLRVDIDAAGWTAAVVAIFLAVFWATTIGPLSSGSDALDHLGTVRAIVERGDLEPNTVFYETGDGRTPDIRKGFLHVWMAAMSRVSGLDPVTMWYALTSWLAGLSALAFLPLARALISRPKAMVLAMLAYPLFVHGNSHWFLDTIAYPHNVGWAAIWLVLALAVTRVTDTDAAPSRWWFVPLVVPLAAWHVFAPLLLLSALVTLPAGFWVARDATAARRVGGDIVVVALMSAPILAWRIWRTYLPINPLHTGVNEVFFITDWLTLHSLDSTFRKFPPAILALVVLSVFVLRRSGTRGSADGRRRVALLALSWCPMLVTFNPIAGRILQPKIGYMFERFLGIIPFPALAAVLITDHRRRPWVRWTVTAGVIISALTVIPGWWLAAKPDTRVAERLTSPERWRAGLDLLTTHTPPGATIATDPATGYAIPAYTGRRIIATLDQHSSPSDSTILFRLEDAAIILNPYRPLEDAIRRLDARGAAYVLVNEGFGAPWRSYFDTRRPRPEPRTIARFAESSCFRKVASADGCTLFERLYDEPCAITAQTYAGLIDSPTACDRPVGEHFALCRTEIVPAVAAPGDMVAFVMHVRKTAVDREATPYRWTVRVRRRLDPDEEQFAPIERWYARFLSPAQGERREFVVSRRPTNGRYPPRLWDVGDVVADTVWARVPNDLTPGAYEVGVSMRPRAFARNVALRDLLNPRRGMGLPIGGLEVSRP